MGTLQTWATGLTVATVSLFLLGPGLVQVGALPPGLGFYMFLGSGLFGLLAALLGVILAFKGGLSAAWRPLIVGLIPLVVIVISGMKGGDAPMINDVSTNLDDPPTFTAAAADPGNEGKDLTYPEAFKEVVRKSYPDLEAKTLSLPAPETFARVLAAARSHPGFVIVREDARAGEIEGFETSGLFRFVDDFVIRIRSTDGGTRVDMRSRSRVGKGDFGVNAKRIRAFFARL